MTFCVDRDGHDDQALSRLIGWVHISSSSGISLFVRIISSGIKCVLNMDKTMNEMEQKITKVYTDHYFSWERCFLSTAVSLLKMVNNVHFYVLFTIHSLNKSS